MPETSSSPSGRSGCDVPECPHPERTDFPEGRCECHSWNCTYKQLGALTTCHRDFPQDFGHLITDPSCSEHDLASMTISGARCPVCRPVDFSTPTPNAGSTEVER